MRSLGLTDAKSKQNLEKFRTARPRILPPRMLRLTSWADPFSAAADEDDVKNSIPSVKREQSYTAPLSPVRDTLESMSIDEVEKMVNFKRENLLQR